MRLLAPCQLATSSWLASACAAGGGDLFRDGGGGARVGAAPVGVAAEVVHDHLGAF